MSMNGRMTIREAVEILTPIWGNRGGRPVQWVDLIKVAIHIRDLEKKLEENHERT